MTPHPYCRHHEGETCNCDLEFRRPAVQKPSNHRQRSPEAYQRKLARQRHMRAGRAT